MDLTYDAMLNMRRNGMPSGGDGRRIDIAALRAACTRLARVLLSTTIMPVPRALFEQIKQVIPPLTGVLHKGQSGA